MLLKYYLSIFNWSKLAVYTPWNSLGGLWKCFVEVLYEKLLGLIMDYSKNGVIKMWTYHMLQ